MKDSRSIRPLVPLGAAVLLLLVVPPGRPAAPESNSVPGTPLTLEWRDMDGLVGPWRSDDTSFTSFYAKSIKLRAEGEPEHVGTFVRVIGRVSIGPAFFAPGSWGYGDPDYEGLNPAMNPPWSLADVAGADIPGSPVTILPRPQLQQMLTDGWCYECPGSQDQLTDYYQPILNSANADREWSGQYTWFLLSTRNWWDLVLSRPNDDEYIINAPGMMQQLITDQTDGAINGQEFWTRGQEFNDAVAAGLTMELQLLTFSGSNTDLGTFPSTDDNPPPVVTAWVATGTSNSLTYTFTNTEGNINYPANWIQPPYAAMNPVNGGDSVEIKLNGLHENTYVEVQIGTDPTLSNWPIAPAPSGDPMTGAVQIPVLGNPPGTKLRFKRYVNDWGGANIPDLHEVELTYMGP